MLRKLTPVGLGLACLVLVGIISGQSNDSTEEAARALLEKNCLSCHGESPMSGLDLRTRDGVLRGGKRGPAVVPGKSAASLLYQAVLRTGELKMPFGKDPLSPAEIKILRDWIDAGAKWPAEQPPARAGSESATGWAFRRPVRPALPKVKSSTSVRNPIDAFILAKLEDKGLKPAPPADKLTLVRRAYFDLIGLPPTPEQVKSFVEDNSPDAYEKLLEQLLASPHYGERWGRYWLDVVRYADSTGFEDDLYFPNAWRYRDYVIKSFNQDKPYSEFVQEQIAADEIRPNNTELEGSYILPKEKQIDFERRIGTGLYTIGPIDPVLAINGEQERYDHLVDMTDVTGLAFLGLTVGCARCHDHKFDPIPQRDYYRLQAFFAGSEEKVIPAVDPEKIHTYRKTADSKLLAVDELKAAVLRIDQEAKQRIVKRVEAKLPAEVLEAHSIPLEKQTLKQKELERKYAMAISAIKEDGVQKELTIQEKTRREKLIRELGEAYVKVPKPYGMASVVGHSDQIPDVYVAIRGDYKNKGSKVNPGFPAVLSDGKDLTEPSGVHFVPQRRKALALWLTQPDHPLTARVMVNRIWQGHFGRGIVGTPNDFGRQGDPPTHPELLDWLATEFVARGWSVKTMHRLVMLSNTYRMSDAYEEAAARLDPTNRLLWRMNRRRLAAEEIRDAVLASAGTLNPRMGGPPIIPPLNPEELSSLDDPTQWPATRDPSDPLRRTVYLFSKRTFRVPLLETFDMPDSSLSCPRREQTNVAPQALALMNNDFIFRQAEAFAERLMKQYGNDPAAWVEKGWEIALGRTPTEAEKQKALGMVGPVTVASVAGGHAADAPRDSRHALTKLCLILFNLNEFIYID